MGIRQDLAHPRTNTHCLGSVVKRGPNRQQSLTCGSDVGPDNSQGLRCDVNKRRDLRDRLNDTRQRANPSARHAGCLPKPTPTTWSTRASTESGAATQQCTRPSPESDQMPHKGGFRTCGACGASNRTASKTRWEAGAQHMVLTPHTNPQTNNSKHLKSGIHQRRDIERHTSLLFLLLLLRLILLVCPTPSVCSDSNTSAATLARMASRLRPRWGLADCEKPCERHVEAAMTRSRRGARDEVLAQTLALPLALRGVLVRAPTMAGSATRVRASPTESTPLEHPASAELGVDRQDTYRGIKQRQVCHTFSPRHGNVTRALRTSGATPADVILTGQGSSRTLRERAMTRD